LTTASTFTTGSVTSADGTTIGYRQIGQGPGLILVHGGMMASQNFTKLAEALADTFAVYVPDRRGRGMSGPYTEDHSVRKEVEDLQALLSRTDTHNVFGLSAGAVISLEATRQLPEIHKLAIYEPPLSFHDSSSTDWVPRYDREIAEGKVASAFVTVVKGTKDSPVMERIPRFLLVPLLGLAIKADAKEVKDGDVALADLIRTMHYDASVVSELADSLERFRTVSADVLLLRGAKSARYLHTAYDRLATVLPKVRTVELPGVGHLAADNGGKPELVATELRSFFGGSDTA
jgi:pimeloyl-ACP methyl ester carboxylesterase